MKSSRKLRAFADPQCLAVNSAVHTSVASLEKRRGELEEKYRHRRLFDRVNKANASIQVLDPEFGSGLDFLLTWQLWQQAGCSAALTYVAISELPYSLEQLRLCHQQWPQFKDLAVALQAQYPLPIKGFHQLDFGLVKLILVQASRAEALAQIQAEFDVCLGSAEASQATYQAPWQRSLNGLGRGNKVAVIGAGISGTATAYSLSQRGFEVTLIEQGANIACGASGNRQAMLYAKLPDNATLAGQFHQQGLQHSMALLKRSLNPCHWQACGLLQLAKSAQEQKQMQAVMLRNYPKSWLQYVSQQEAETIAKQPLAAGGLYFPHSGWVSPADWCAALFQLSGAHLWCNSQVLKLTQADAWQLSIAGEHQGQHRFDAVVLANANAAKALVPQQRLTLQSIRGQVSYVTSDQAPQVVVCGEGYVTPAQKGMLAVGASYNLHADDLVLSEQDHVDNLMRMSDVMPQSTATSLAAIQGGRVGFRSVTPDYLPMVGQIADETQFIQRFAKLRQDANYKFADSVPYLEGLYINAGHGSKGLISAPLSAEILACQMANQALPVAQCVAWGLDPNRFLIRDLMRRKR